MLTLGEVWDLNLAICNFFWFEDKSLIYTKTVLVSRSVTTVTTTTKVILPTCLLLSLWYLSSYIDRHTFTILIATFC